MPNLFRHPTGYHASQVDMLHIADLYMVYLSDEVPKQVRHDVAFFNLILRTSYLKL